MKKLVTIFLALTSLLFASQVHSFDATKIKHLTKSTKSIPPNNTWITKSITTLHISDLASLTKHEQIDLMLQKAVTEGRIKWKDKFAYRNKLNEFIDYDEFPKYFLDCLKDDVCKVTSFIDKSPRKPVIWQNTQEIGRFGEHWTARNLTAMGYTKLNSKLDEIHGIDGVYIQKNASDNITKIIVTESKVNGSSLNNSQSIKQMSDQWLGERIEKMLVNESSEVRKTGELLKNNPQMIEKQLWNINTNTGVVRVDLLDDTANIVGKPVHRFQSGAMLEALRKKTGDT